MNTMQHDEFFEEYEKNLKLYFRKNFVKEISAASVYRSFSDNLKDIAICQVKTLILDDCFCAIKHEDDVWNKLDVQTQNEIDTLLQCLKLITINNDETLKKIHSIIGEHKLDS